MCALMIKGLPTEYDCRNPPGAPGGRREGDGRNFRVCVVPG